MVLIFSKTKSLENSIFILVLCYSFVQASEVSSYGILPYVDPTVNGSIYGIIGAGGNTGAVCFGLGLSDLGYKSFVFLFFLISC